MSVASVQDVQPYARRGVCPALSAPMQTGDGLLSRIAFTDDLSPRAFGQLCALAVRHGNGLVDITARGGLQFRGLTAQSAVMLETDVLALDLPLRHGLAVETSPLAGIDETEIADPRTIADQISTQAAALDLHDRLAAKMSVIVDGDGRVPMGGLLADIRLKAKSINGTVVWQIMLGGTEARALHAGTVSSDHAADVVIDILSHLASRGTDARGRDLDLDDVRATAADRLVPSTPETPPSAASPPFGVRRLSAGRFALLVAPAFGQISAEALGVLCHHAATLNIPALRPGPSHGLFFIGSKHACLTLMAYATRAGFVTGGDDPRSSIAVCSGKPACASGFIETHDLAQYAAQHCAALLDGSFTLHLSGCGKGCAHPGATLLAFAGRDDGLGFSLSARVSDTPQAVLPFNDRKAALSRLARLYEKEHKPGENARTLLARLGTQRVVAALRQDER